MGIIGRPRAYHPDRPSTTTERQRVFARKRQDELALLRVKLRTKVYHASQRTTWGTPWPLFHEYDATFHFTLDVCATADNTKCARYFSPEHNGLVQDWRTDICWMNAPYGKPLGQWMQKAWESAQAGATVVCLLPVRSDTGWWQRYCVPPAEIRYIPGRLTFVGAANPAPFPSAVVIFRPG
jgi:phage N-6-adenine-methyltransferase